MKNSLHVVVGDRVAIRSRGHWADNEWGIVVLIREDEYHVSPWGDDNHSIVLSRNEIKRNATCNAQIVQR